MATFELRETNPDGSAGQAYEIEAPDQATAVEAFKRMTKGGAPYETSGKTQFQKDILGTLYPSNDLPFSQRFKRGVADIGQGVVQLLDKAGVLPYNGQGTYTQAIADQQAKYEQSRSAAGGSGFDPARTAGNAAMMLPAAGVAPEAGAGWLSALGMGALTGAGTGGLMPVTDDTKPFLPQKIQQMEEGAVGGLAGGALTKGLSALVKPNVSPAVEALKKTGVTPTWLQSLGLGRAEDKLTSIPVVGNAVAGGQKRALDSWYKAVINEVLAPIGGKVDKIGYEGADAAHALLTQKYDELLPNLKFKVDDQFVGEMTNLANLAAEMPEEQAKRFGDIITKKVYSRLSPTDTMDGETFKGVESELNRIARGLLRDQSFDNRELGSAVNEALRLLRGNLDRANPMFRGKLGPINEAYSRLITLENATARLGTDDGVFTPSQFMGAIRNTDKSIRKSKFARGEAAMMDMARQGKQVLGQKYPDSGTVGRGMIPAMAVGAAGWGDLGLTLAGLTGAAVPFTRPGQFLISAATSGARPKGSQAVADLINRALLPVAAGSGAYGARN